jgi:polyisoprenoid-binding protein YceI
MIRSTAITRVERRLIVFLGILAYSPGATAAPETFVIDPDHTYPSFEADHFGLSVWRGKMNESPGTVVLDRVAESGIVMITIEAGSIDFGHAKLNAWAAGAELLDVSTFPQAKYVGTFTRFINGNPTRLVGDLTLHGITRPVDVTINSLACEPHPMLKREWCGADAFAVFKRDDFGLDSGEAYGFNMDVMLRIQVEALKDE